MKFVHVYYVFSPLHVILNSPPSGTFSHFVYFNFLALFFVWFGFVCMTSENQLFFPHRHQRSISFLCCSVPCPISSLITLLPLLFPYSSHPWFLSSFSSFFAAPLGAFSSSFLPSWLRHSPGKVLTNSSWAVCRVISGRDTYKGILRLSCYIIDWSDSSSSF